MTILVMRSLTHPSMKSFVVQLGGNFGRTVTLFSPDVTYGEALARREEHLTHLESVNIRLWDELEELHQIQIAKTTANIGAFQKKDAGEVYDVDQLFAYLIEEFGEELAARESRFFGDHRDLYERFMAFCMEARRRALEAK